MLFGPIVFMSRTLCGQWISVVLVFVLKLNIASNSQTPHDSATKFDGNFDNFLKDLGSMVYKSKKIAVNGNDMRTTHDRMHTTPAVKIYRRRESNYNTQKSILADVLMMKLVSYYEDKYKLTHLEPTTTERITMINTNSFINNIAHKYSIERSNINKAVVQHTDLPTNRVAYGLNRRMQEDMRRADEYTMPEVVIL